MANSLLCVHAHPDDESLFTGGVLALAHAAGAATTVVTCTDGRYGYSPGEVPFGTEAHDPEGCAALRAEDLVRACAALGVSRLEHFDYHDSGMRGWEINAAPEAFVNQDVDTVARRVAAVIDEERPDLVVTYDRFGVYGHPDHIKVYEVTLRALELAEHTPALKLVTVQKSAIAALGQPDENGDLPQWLADMAEFGSTDDEVVAMVDVRAVLGTKRAGIEAHRSQVDNHFFLSLDEGTFELLLGGEVFTALEPTGEVLRSLL